MTAEQIKTGFRVMVAVVETIREAGRVAEGTIYAAMCDKVSLPAFESLIQRIVNTGLVRREAPNTLVWTGPNN